MASRSKAVLIVAVAAVAALLPATAFAAVYRVGDDDGWNKLVDFEAWADGKNFKDGDILEFVYQPGIHDVVRGDQETYEACTIPPNDLPWLSSGDDRVVLVGEGNHYFVSLVEADCEDGMKLHVVTTY